MRSVPNSVSQPIQYKVYSSAEKIELPKEVSYSGLSVGEAIEKRRSTGDFSSEAMSLIELSRLLHYATGITEKRYCLRAAPSAGALYPIELYAVINNVEGLATGVYHYSIGEHSLDVLRKADFRKEMVQHCLGQEMVGQANVAFIMTALFHRSRWKYQERTLRYTLLEAGHIAQNIYLTATSMGLGACAVGAFSDDDINPLLRIDRTRESVVYLVVVGNI